MIFKSLPFDNGKFRGYMGADLFTNIMYDPDCGWTYHSAAGLVYHISPSASIQLFEAQKNRDARVGIAEIDLTHRRLFFEGPRDDPAYRQ